MMTQSRRVMGLLLVLVALAIALGVLYALFIKDDDDEDDDALTVSGAWVRAATGGTTTGAFMEIANGDDDADRLIAAAAPGLSETVEMHETTIDASSVMQMRPVTGIDVPGEGSVELKPGGFHLMLLDIERDLTPGDSVELILSFESGASLTVTAEVRTLDATGMGN